MATTTPNFGWSVPTSTDLVKDGATAIETLGDAIDASLVDLKGGTTGQVLAKASNSDMDFVWSADAAGMTNPMTTTGDTIYSSSGSTPARLGIGSTGQVLTVAGGVPVWSTPAGGGKVLQVIQGTTTTYGSSTSSSYADTGLSATITPSSSSSRILAIVSQHISANGDGSSHGMVALRLVRGATQIQEMNYNCGLVSSGFTLGVPAALQFLDSPATTSATTYKTQFMRPTGAGQAQVNNGSNPATIVLLEIGA